MEQRTPRQYRSRAEVKQILMIGNPENNADASGGHTLDLKVACAPMPSDTIGVGENRNLDLNLHCASTPCFTRAVATSG